MKFFFFVLFKKPINKIYINDHHNTLFCEILCFSFPFQRSATIRSSTNNPSIGGLNCSSDENLSASNEIIPKLTIKLDNHNQHNSSSDSPRNSVQTPGVKLTLKQVSEPPIPKFTITNAFNDTAKVVMLNNNEQTDESSDELPSQPPSNQPSPSGKTSTRNDYVTHTITSTSSSYSGTTAEDNLSTCSSSSTSSYSSSSSLIHPNNDIKLIIKVNFCHSIRFASIFLTKIFSYNK